MDKESRHRIYEFEKFRLDTVQLMLYRDGQELSLTPKAVETLIVLIERRGRIVSKDELMKIIWTDVVVEDSNLSKYLHLLRKTLGQQKNGTPFIETFRRRGYRFNGEVTVGEPAAEIKTERPAPSPIPRQPTGGAIREATASNVVVLASRREAARANEQTTEKVSAEIEKAKTLPDNRRNFRLAAVFFGLLILAVGGWSFNKFRSNAPPALLRVESIAVLPFENATGNADLDYLADGLSESTIDRLSQLPQLKVIARTSSFKYRGQNVDPRTAAESLGVQAIVMGRITGRDDDLLIRVEMIDVRENLQIWSEQYKRRSADALAAQDEIARAAADKLRIDPSSAKTQKPPRNYTDNAEAYQLYLRGRFLQSKFTPPDLFKSIEFYRQAVALDPNFALAFVGLSEATIRISGFRDIPLQDYRRLSREYALKAVALDDRSAEAHAALGDLLLLDDYDFAGAEREFNRALELNPNYAEVRLWRGRLLSRLGRHEEALAEILRGIELDPLSLEANTTYGEALFFARRYDESIAQLKKVLNLEANYFPARRYLAFNYEMKGDYAARIDETVKINGIGGASERGEAIRKSFERGGWQGFLRDAADDKFDLHPYLTAVFCAELGEKDKAFAILEKLYEERSSDLVVIKVDPRLDNLRADSRFGDLLNRLGLQ